MVELDRGRTSCWDRGVTPETRFLRTRPLGRIQVAGGPIPATTGNGSPVRSESPQVRVATTTPDLTGPRCQGGSPTTHSKGVHRLPAVAGGRP